MGKSIFSRPILCLIARKRRGRSQFFFSPKEAQLLFRQLQKLSAKNIAALIIINGDSYYAIEKKKKKLVCVNLRQRVHVTPFISYRNLGLFTNPLKYCNSGKNFTCPIHLYNSTRYITLTSPNWHSRFWSGQTQLPRHLPRELETLQLFNQLHSN